MAVGGDVGGTVVMRRPGMPAAPVLRLSACVCRCRLPVHQHLWLPRCETLAVDDHQRRVWAAMLDQVREYRAGRVGLGALVAGLRGLFVEADPHSPAVPHPFESLWSPIYPQYQLRTQ